MASDIRPGVPMQMLQLAEKGTVARKEDVEASEAAVRTLEGRMAEASVQLRDATLRAPYDGVVAQRFGR